MRKTQMSAGFQHTSYSTQSGFPKAHAVPVMTQPNLTSASFFSTGNQTMSNFNKAQSLTSNIETLDKEQLKERLLVAETLMKKLFNRNKELEQFMSDHNTPGMGNNEKQNLDTIHDAQHAASKDTKEEDSHTSVLDSMKAREDSLMREIEEKQAEIERLKQMQLDSLKA